MTMSELPQAPRPRYQKIRELGRNHEGGRVTYLARDNKRQQLVVIKQFQFAQAGSNWSAFKAYEREIQVLKSLNHPGIPRYLKSCETRKGFCLIQEYKEAESLSVIRSFSPQEIKQIAINILEILSYLQSRIPPLIHRDIKPENILLDDNLNVYLVDFGLAKTGSMQMVAMSSIVAGTPGFMPPEQLLNRPLTEAADLYGLGVTLICLLTGTKSTEIVNIIDSNFKISFQPFVTQLSSPFIEWLEKLVDPNANERYPNAKSALGALKPLHVTCVPKVSLIRSAIDLEAVKLGDKINYKVRVSNSISDTLLEGKWEVAPHSSDPPHSPDFHPWIWFTPKQFSSNKAECQITVDTSKLLADKVYEREVYLQTNSLPKQQILKLKIKTAPLPIKNINMPYIQLTALGILCFLCSWLSDIGGDLGLLFLALWSIFGNDSIYTLGAAQVEKLTRIIKDKSGDIARVIAVLETFIFAIIGITLGWFVGGLGAIIGGTFGGIIGLTLGSLLMLTAHNFADGLAVVVNSCSTCGRYIFRDLAVVDILVTQGFGKGFSSTISLLVIGLATSLGVGCTVGFFNSLVLLAVLVTGLPLMATLLYLPITRQLATARYHARQQHLIKP